MGTVWYCSREDVKSASDFKETARSNRQIDRAIEAASRSIEGVMHRKFYPQVDTRYFDWSNTQNSKPWRLWLDQHELISVTNIAMAGISLSPTDYYLRPENDGPPFTYIDLNRDVYGAFSASSTGQRSIVIDGVFGHSSDENSAGTFTSAVNGSQTSVDVSDSSVLGVGNAFRVDNERFIITEKLMVDTTQNLGTPLTAVASDVTVAVTTGSAFTTGETILLDSERMLIVDIAGNNLTVKRAWDGSVLATHTGSDIYAPRTLLVDRAALGTTASTHALNAPIYLHEVPGPVQDLSVAVSINSLLQKASGYNRTSGSGDNEREITGKALRALWDEVYTSYGRKARIRGI